MWAKNKEQNGFTIVELLIVIVVIGILAAITIVAYNGVQQRARASAASLGLTQTKEKLELYKLDNNNYPTTGNLAAAGVVNSDTIYQYTSDGTTYCITGTNGNVSYKATDTAVPTQGGCPGHGQGGIAAITNYYLNPKPASTSYAGAWDGGNTLSTSNTTSTWSRSGRANRMNFSTVTTQNGGPTIFTNGYTAGQKYTIVTSLRLVSGTGGVGSVSIDRNTNAGVLTVHSIGGNGTTLSTTSTRYVYATFTADSTALNDGLRLYIQLSNKASGTIVDYADIDLYPGDYNASRKWADGDSADWTWNGTPNNSGSTGPAL